MKADRVLLALSLVLLVATLFLAGLSLRITDMTLRIQTMCYATYIFISGIAILILVEIIHLTKKEISRSNI
jgi:hypothetical protein